MQSVIRFPNPPKRLPPLRSFQPLRPSRTICCLCSGGRRAQTEMYRRLPTGAIATGPIDKRILYNLVPYEILRIATRITETNAHAHIQVLRRMHVHYTDRRGERRRTRRKTRRDSSTSTWSRERSPVCRLRLRPQLSVYRPETVCRSAALREGELFSEDEAFSIRPRQLARSRAVFSSSDGVAGCGVLKDFPRGSSYAWCRLCELP